jgi:predicted ATP-grasp superfamily ATP-dependent carboligase
MSKSNSTPNLPPAVVLGLDTHTGLQTARFLARKGVPVIGIASDVSDPFCKTRVCERILSANTDDDGLLVALHELGDQLSQKAVLVPCTDMSVLTISQNRQSLVDTYHIVLPSAETVEMLIHKADFYVYARKAGLPVPETYVLGTRADAEKAAEALSYPAILKPTIKSPAWQQRTSKKLFKADNPDQLLDLYDRCSDWAETLVAQEWIAGQESCLFQCMNYFGANSEPLVAFTYRKIRQWPPYEGSSTCVVEARNDALMIETLKLFSDLNLVGFGHLEVKQDETSGKHYFIEVNVGRPAGSAALVEGAGVELRFTMYCDAVGLPLPENREQGYLGVKYLCGRLDFQSALLLWLRKELTLKAWWTSRRGPRAPGLFLWRDPFPFLWDLLYLVPTKPRHFRRAWQVLRVGRTKDS